MSDHKCSEGEIIISDDQEISVYSEGKNDSVLTTIKAYQTIYDQITGKKQQISKFFNIDYIIEFPQLDQLNTKVLQLLKQYHVISKNCLINIMHENDDEEVFDSYEKFSTYNTSNIHPITIANLRYNFSLLCPGERRISNYSLNIIISPGNIPPSPLRDRFRNLRYTGPTIEVRIDYADYVIARTFIENVSDWVRSVEIEKKKNPIKTFLRKRTDYISVILKGIILIIIGGILLLNNKQIVPEYSNDLNNFFVVCLIVAFIIFISYSIMGSLGDTIEYAIDISKKYSLICLNEGDRKYREKMNSKNKKSIGKAIFSFLGAVITSLASGIILKLVFKL